MIIKETVMKVIKVLKTAMDENLERFEDGTFHRADTMWADDTFMSLPFMARGGYWIVISTLAGTETNIKLRPLLTKGLHLVGSMLRNRTPEFKAYILSELVKNVLFTQIQFLNNRTISFNINFLKVCKKVTSVTNHFKKTTA